MSFQPLWGSQPSRPPGADILAFPELVEDPDTELTVVPELAPEEPAQGAASEDAASKDTAQLEEARAQGLEEGHAAGVQSVQEELKVLRAQVAEQRELLQGLELAGEQARASLGEQAVAICVALSRRVLADTLIHESAALSNLVLQTMRRFPGGSEIHVRVPPDRVEQIQELLGKHCVVVEGDPEIEGGCVIERGGCSVDASLRVLMEGLDQALSKEAE